jgi:hypothetical protein
VAYNLGVGVSPEVVGYFLNQSHARPSWILAASRSAAQN